MLAGRLATTSVFNGGCALILCVILVHGWVTPWIPAYAGMTEGGTGMAPAYGAELSESDMDLSRFLVIR